MDLFNNSFFRYEKVEDRYRLYTNDIIWDFLYEEIVTKNPAAFGCHLYKIMKNTEF